MRLPFDNNPLITSPFGVTRTYTNTSGQTITDIHNGVDYGVSYGTPVKAPESGQAYMQWDPYGGGNMVVIDGASGRHVLLHNSKFNGGNRTVKEGEVVAYVGATGNVTGAHSHWGLKRNGVWVNPLSFLNNNSYNNNMETITVQSGWGLSHVATAAGLPTTVETYQTLFELNRGHRGATNWQELNARMGPGDVLKVRTSKPTPTPSPVDNSTEVKKLNEQIKKLEQEKVKIESEAKAKYEELVALNAEKEAIKAAEIAKLTEKLTERGNILQNELEAVRGQLSELQRHSVQIPDTNEVIATGINIVVEEAKARGLKASWHSFVDKHFKSDYVRSLLKYDWFLILFVGVTTFLTLLQSYNGDSEVILGVVSFITGIGGQMLKYILTNYDRNKDGKIDFRDSETWTTVNRVE